MVLLVLHGEAGGWDELIIAVVALAVLWVAVKIAGRKSADEDEHAETSSAVGGETAPRDGSPGPAAAAESVSPPVGKRA